MRSKWEIPNICWWKVKGKSILPSFQEADKCFSETDQLVLHSPGKFSGS
jgi:hypothetical protein